MNAPWDRPKQRQLYAPVEARPGLVVTHRATGTSGRIVRLAGNDLYVKRFTGVEAVFTNAPGAFVVDNERIELVEIAGASVDVAPQITASGSLKAHDDSARVARQSRIFVEGRHDAELLEKVWGDDLRAEAIAVETLGGLDRLSGVVAAFEPGPGRRLGVLADHLVEGTKEARIACSVANPYILVTGHPYVDIWQAIRPRAVGILEWPTVPRGTDWKSGVCEFLGEDAYLFWPKVLGSVKSFKDLETPLINAVERLIDFVTASTPA